MKVFDRPIIIQTIDELTEDWIDVFKIRASINKAKTDNEFLGGGAVQGKRYLMFEVRYFKKLEEISYNTQYFRIVYQGVTFNIVDYDDFMLQHKTVKLLGISY